MIYYLIIDRSKFGILKTEKKESCTFLFFSSFFCVLLSFQNAISVLHDMIDTEKICVSINSYYVVKNNPRTS